MPYTGPDAADASLHDKSAYDPFIGGSFAAPVRGRPLDANTHPADSACRMDRAAQAGRVWAHRYRAYPAHATFGGYRESGIGRKTRQMMLDHDQQTKNLLVSDSPDTSGFF